MVSMMTPAAACRIAIVDKNRAAGPSFTSQLAGLFFFALASLLVKLDCFF